MKTYTLKLASELKTGESFTRNIDNATTLYRVHSVAIVQNGRFPVRVGYSRDVFFGGKMRVNCAGGAVYFQHNESVRVL